MQFLETNEKMLLSVFYILTEYYNFLILYSKNCNQPSLVQRYLFEAFIKAGTKHNFIAEHISVYPATMICEHRRNNAKRGRTSGDYVAKNAQRKTDNRYRSKPKLVKFMDKIKKQAVKWLSEDKWSHELISLIGNRTGKFQISV